MREAGLRVELFANPILPYVTERDLPGLADCAAKIGVRLGGFGLVHYLERHVGGKLRAAYRHFGPEALARLKAAQQDPGYEAQVRRLVAEVTVPTIAAITATARRDAAPLARFWPRIADTRFFTLLLLAIPTAAAGLER